MQAPKTLPSSDVLSSDVPSSDVPSSDVLADPLPRRNRAICFPRSFGSGADLELFFAPPGLGRHMVRGEAAKRWVLGFGPVGGGHSIWGLYWLDEPARVVSNYELFWRTRPGAIELFRWSSRIVGVDLAARLIETVGSLESFYERHFASRPDSAPPEEKPELVLDLTIRAPTAAQVAEEALQGARQITSIATRRLSAIA